MSEQTSSSGSPYPTNDSALTLSSGTVVRQRNLVVFHGFNVSKLTIVIETPTVASDTRRVAQEAQEVAALHDTFASTRGTGTITVDVCRTQACFELREAATETFHFARAHDGSWQPVDLRAP